MLVVSTYLQLVLSSIGAGFIGCAGKMCFVGFVRFLLAPLCAVTGVLVGLLPLASPQVAVKAPSELFVAIHEGGDCWKTALSNCFAAQDGDASFTCLESG